MRRRDIGQSTIVEPIQFGAVDALAVHRHPVQSRTGHGERMTRRPIPRILDRHAIARLYQQLCTKANPLLCATGDHYLLSRALHAPGTAQIRGNQTAQSRIARRIAVTQLLEIRFTPESRIQLGPDLEREQIESRNTHPKCAGRTDWEAGPNGSFQPAPMRRCG